MLLAQYKYPKKVAREAFMGMMWLACHISLVAPGYVRGNQTLGDLWRSGKDQFSGPRPSIFSVSQDYFKVHVQPQ